MATSGNSGRWWGVATLVAIAAATPPPVGGQAANDAARRCLAESPTERAISICRESVRATPSDASLRRALAAALTARGDTAGALAEFTEILRADPHSARAQLDVATTLDRMGRADEALRAYR